MNIESIVIYLIVFTPSYVSLTLPLHEDTIDFRIGRSFAELKRWERVVNNNNRKFEKDFRFLT